MAMRKYAEGEGKMEVLRGAEANVLHDHMERLRKFSVAEFSDEEKDALQRDLSEVRKQEEDEARASDEGMPEPEAK